MMYTEHHQQDPLIMLNSHHMEDLLVPITIKPLPALLAPPTNLSLSAASLQTPNATNSYYQHTNESHQMESMSVSEPSPLPHTMLPDLPPSPLRPSTVNPPNYYSVIQKQSQEIQELRQDLIRLNQKYVDQIERMQTAEHAKHQVESELEDLSSRLFEQANQMVSDEKKARFHAERKITLLERELTCVYEELSNERAQLNELRGKLHEPSVHPLDHQHSTPPQELLSPQVQHGISTAAYLDHGWLNLFKDFLTSAPKTPLEQIHKLQFMKQCLELDIEPCLRFGNNVKGGGQFSTKRVLDAILHQSCFIESETSFMKRFSHDTAASTTTTAPLVVARRSSFAQLASRLRPSSAAAAAVVKQLCYGCGAELQAPLFRFRLKEQDTDSFTIDRACRDRLVAVCDFYVFIRHVRLGLQSQKTIQCLFRECVWLRLCMFWARSGIHHDDSALSASE